MTDGLCDEIERDDVVLVLKSVMDPEIYIDIWTLGLIYDIAIDAGAIRITMTFTSVACPAGPQLVYEIKDKLSDIPGVKSVDVEVVFEPPWAPSEDLKAMMGI